MAVRCEDRGYVLVTAALAIVVLIGMAGLGIDIGVLRYEQRHMQSAADSAAVAGASEPAYDQVKSAALADAAKNGFQNGSSNGVGTASVAVHNPPTSGPHNGDGNYVIVDISQRQLTFFVKIFNIDSAMVSARAVAYAGASGTDCIYALDPAASNTIVTSGSGQINANCDIVDDSADSSKAFVDSGQACVSATLRRGSTGRYDRYDNLVAEQPARKQRHGQRELRLSVGRSIPAERRLNAVKQCGDGHFAMNEQAAFV